LTAPLVELALHGGIGTLFAYGQTGSGKTYTIAGIERLVAENLLNEDVLGGRKVSVAIFELGGTLNSAFGTCFAILWDEDSSSRQISSIPGSKCLC